jgi:hypothetical protein
VAEASSTHIDFYHRSRVLRLTKRLASARPPVSYDGLFRTAIRKVTAARDLEAGTSACTIQLEVAWEPRLEPLLLEIPPHDIVLQDEHGRPLSVPADGRVQAFVDGRLAFSFDVSLPAVPRSAHKIGLFAGKLSAVAPTAMSTLSFDNLTSLAGGEAALAARSRSEHGMTCTITKVNLFSDRGTVQVRLDLPSGGPSLESYQSWVVNNEMWLQRKDGSKRYPANYSPDSASARHAILSYHFTDKDVLKRPADWVVFYRTPAGLVEIPFSFSFKDVPLP